MLAENRTSRGIVRSDNACALEMRSGSFPLARSYKSFSRFCSHCRETPEASTKVSSRSGRIGICTPRKLSSSSCKRDAAISSWQIMTDGRAQEACSAARKWLRVIWLRPEIAATLPREIESCS